MMAAKNLFKKKKKSTRQLVTMKTKEKLKKKEKKINLEVHFSKKKGTSIFYSFPTFLYIYKIKILL